MLEPGPLEQLLPEWSREYPGMKVPAGDDDFRILTQRGSFKPVPDWLVRLLPRSMTYSTPFNNHGNYIISLGQLTPWLAAKAEALGVEIFPGFAAAAACSTSMAASRACASATWGSISDGRARPQLHPRRRDPRAAHGAGGRRARLARQAAHRADSISPRGHCPQTFALGYKELWQLPAGRVRPGRIEHGLGWPADSRTYAGSFLYHLDNDRVYVGYIVGLDYEDPRLQPFEAFQQYKNHPSVKPLLEGGEILSAGARTIAAGGWQSTPTLEMPGAILIGDAGGTLNFAKIKGVHQAIRSRRARRLSTWRRAAAGTGFDARWRASPGGQELKRVRNFKPAFKRGMWLGLINSAWEMLTGGTSPWTLKNTATGRVCRSSTSSPRPIGTGWSARCRRAIACRSCSSPATRTRRASRCT